MFSSSLSAAAPGAGLNIRPIRLPISTRPESSENENNQENRNKPSAAEKLSNNNKKSTRPNNRNNNRNTPKPNVNINSKPRICQRLVVNCKTSPEHRCCLYQQNEGK